MPAACALCGTPAPPPFRAPPPELAPDLDLRPGEPTRSTLGDWVRVCAGCGAAAPDLSALPEAARAVVASDAYRALGGAGAPFLRWAAICEAAICEVAGARETAAEALLQAAWAADDAGDEAAARARRLRAAALWGDAPRDPRAGQQALDALRRAGAFDRAAALADALDHGPLDPDAARILRFQRARIAARDTLRHSIASALPPPARSPHVAHGRTPPRKPAGDRGGLWRKLFGR